MKDIIQLLPDVVANQIAAGEVIQRPASVIKELVENAVDAGASAIDVLVVEAGRTSIQVIDNGKGMSGTDARLAFERHATSKIRQAEDLFALQTMGFRGEALASIAAVAQIELKTRHEDDDLGTSLTIAGSKVKGQEPCACPTGSNFLVQNLFYNVPARRRFLKSNTTELKHIVTAFQRIALVYPQIAFTLHSNGTELLNLRPCVLRQRIVDIFGKRINQDLLPVSVDTTMCKISGFVGKPESSKKKGVQQYFFVNGRYMRHPYFHKAVLNAFERLIPQGDQVPYFIYFELNPQEIDVNIHPTKTEIKFENEQAIFQIVFAAVREAVGLFKEVPSIEFNNEGQPDIPVYSGQRDATVAPHVQTNPNYNPFQQTPMPSPHASLDWEKLYEGLEQTPENIALFNSDGLQQNVQNPLIEDKSPVHYQYKGQYLMTAVKSGLMIIDQHRAHVRILYERYLQQMKEGKEYAQKVLFPELIQLSPAEQIIFPKMMPDFIAMGFEFTSMGNSDYAIQSVPAGIEGLNMVQLVHDMLSSALEKDSNAVHEIHQALALSLAKHAAIPAGQVLNNEEMENLINSLFGCQNVNYTPDGKSILHILKQEKIEQLLNS